MTIRCPKGHESVSDDYCDQCGIRLLEAGEPPGGDTASHKSDLVVDLQNRICPACGMPANESAQYCEDCGADLSQPAVPSGQPSAAGAGWDSEGQASDWEVVVCCDRAYFAEVEVGEVGEVEFPSTMADRIIQLAGDQVTIGRRSADQSDAPQIDLSVPPVDTGVSRRHAVLNREPGGSWSVTDCESTNGTYLNDSRETLPPGRPVPVGDGDRIHLGAWTTITLRSRSSATAG